MKKNQIILIFLLLLIVSFELNAQQVVHIENQRLKTEEDGLSGSLTLNLNYTKNQSRILQFGNKIQIQYRLKRSLFLFLNDLNLIRANDENFINNGYQHLRYNYKINNLLTWEAFLQRQTDMVYLLELRALAGTGPRFRIIDRDSISLYAGSLYMYEYEQIEGESEFNSYHRNSSYLSANYDLREFYSLQLIAYYQPNIFNLSDYRISTEIVNVFRINKKLSFRIAYALRYDSSPPDGVTDTFFSIINALRIDL